MTVSAHVLDATVTGRVLRPGAAAYDDARRVWNGMIDRRPQLIVQCATVADVVAAVRTARDLDLEIGVRCGGHGILGLAVPDGGMMIDLAPMSAVRVDPARRRAWVGGGALLGALDQAAQPYGLATTAGNVSHTGVGGLVLGGGMGWLARQYGLACDNVVSYQVVTASGEVVEARRDERPELFWGLRGGGGNFGIVTEFEFDLHAFGTSTLVVELMFEPERALQAMRAWRDLSTEAPRQATFTASIVGRGHTTLGFIWAGDPDHGRRLLPALGALGRPTTRRVTDMSYLDLQQRHDSVQRHNVRRYSKGHYLPGLPDAAIEALFAHRDAGDGSLPDTELQAYGGAIADVHNDDSAFSHRTTAFEFGTDASWIDAHEDDQRITAARDSAAAMEPFAQGIYVNALADEGVHGVHRAYPLGKLARLTALKDRYDPDNVFHLNQNIRPSSRA